MQNLTARQIFLPKTFKTRTRTEQQKIIPKPHCTMKRKLDANDVPSPETYGQAEIHDSDDATFESLNLDPRLRQALTKEKFSKPTLVQAKAIPLALQGKDILGE